MDSAKVPVKLVKVTRVLGRTGTLRSKDNPAKGEREIKREGGREREREREGKREGKREKEKNLTGDLKFGVQSCEGQTSYSSWIETLTSLSPFQLVCKSTRLKVN